MFHNWIKPQSPFGRMILFASVAMNLNPGDLVEFRQAINARARDSRSDSIDFRRNADNIEYLIPRSTQAAVRSTRRLPSGNYALEIQIKTGPLAGRRTWVYYDLNNPALRLYGSDTAAPAQAAEVIQPEKARSARTLREVAPMEQVRTPEDRLAQMIDQIVKRTSQGPAVQTDGCSQDSSIRLSQAGPARATERAPSADASLPPEIAAYLRPSEMIQSDSPEIIAMARKITEGKSGPVARSRAIYEWVATNIRYDEAVAEKRKANLPEDSRQDALFTLQSRGAVCEGYADLFAALHRAIGIPTRVVIGKSYTTNVSASAADFLIRNGRKLDLDSIPTLHGWNEVYINGRWIPVDSTGADLGPKAIDPYTSSAEAFDLTHKKTESWDR